MEKTQVYFTVSEIKMLTAQHLLQEAGIESFVLNKKDSAYAGIFGDIELHVDTDDKERAEEILTEAGILGSD